MPSVHSPFSDFLFLSVAILASHSALAAEDVDFDAVTVTATSISTTTENTDSYKSSSMSTTTGLELTPRETPQSVSNVTMKQISDQGIQSMDEAMKNTTGITVIHNAGRFRYLSRGFYIDNIQEDGISYSLNDGANGNSYRNANSQSDIAIYDHIEVVRGPTGLTQSSSQPGGTINAVRKRPTSEFQASAEAEVGSWDHYRAVGDISGPLNEAKTLRGRVVGVLQKKNSFKDDVGNKSGTFYAVFAADLAPETTLTFGGLHQQGTEVPDFYGVPMGPNGADAGLPDSAFFGMDWTKWKTKKTNVFAELEHYLNDEWRITAKTSYTKSTSESSFGSITNISDGHPISTQSPNMPLKYGQHYNNDGSIFSATLNLNGSYTLFNQEHDFFTTLNYSREKTDTLLKQHNFSGISINAWDFVGNEVSEPNWYDDSILNTKNFYKQTRTDLGLLTGTRYNFSNSWHLIAGGRYALYKTSYSVTNLLKPSAKQTYTETTTTRFIPYAGLTWDFYKNSSIYISYTSIFEPSGEKGPDHNDLKPIIGDNYELGIKSEFFDNRLNTSLAIFNLEQKNRPMDCIIDSAETTCSRGKVRSQGFEAEASGSLLPGWNLFAGYTWNMSEYTVTESASKQSGETYSPFTPRHILRLYSSFNLPGAAYRWTVGGGVQAQSRAKSASSVQQGGYAIWNANIQYQATNSLKFSLIANNIFDRHYYNNTNNRTLGANNYLGDPRNFILKLNYQY